MAAKAPSLEEIITRNWTLDEFLSKGYLESGEILPGLNIRTNDPSLLRLWARQIGRKVEKLYAQIGWEDFRGDLLLVHKNPGRLFFTGGKYSVWFRTNEGFLVLRSWRKFEILDITAFEDVFLSIISLRGEEIEIVSPNPLPEDISSIYDLLYESQHAHVEEINKGLQSGRVIHISGFPIELSVSPIVEMIGGYMMINSENEFIVIGNILTRKGQQSIASVYNYQDGLRLIATLTLNQDKWKLVEL
jgi:hypothetical protein